MRAGKILKYKFIFLFNLASFWYKYVYLMGCSLALFLSKIVLFNSYCDLEWLVTIEGQLNIQTRRKCICFAKFWHYNLANQHNCAVSDETFDITMLTNCSVESQIQVDSNLYSIRTIKSIQDKDELRYLGNILFYMFTNGLAVANCLWRNDQR